MSHLSPGRFLWFEVLCREPDRVREFYTQVCDWNVITWPSPLGTPYEMFAAGEVPVGALFPFPADAPAEHRANPHWLPYFATADVDASVRRLRELGGATWMEPTDLPSVGRTALVRDRTGADFAFFKPENDPAEEPAQAPVGHVGWIECSVPDATQAFADYGALFGWTPAEQFDMGPTGRYHVIHREHRGVGGFYQAAGGVLPPWRWICYVRVADLEGAWNRALMLGGTRVMEPMAVPGGNARIAMLRDPEGATFALQWTE
ncbi:MAG: VOC family protein [Gemmatimonadetes bacterium]|nr:VOC family protein [Gemmatimonadota bacterium]